MGEDASVRVVTSGTGPLTRGSILHDLHLE